MNPGRNDRSLPFLGSVSLTTCLHYIISYSITPVCLAKPAAVCHRLVTKYSTATQYLVTILTAKLLGNALPHTVHHFIVFIMFVSLSNKTGL